MALPPRGIRNNNPGNLNFVHQPGAVLEPTPLNGTAPRFAKFPTAQTGLSALADQLLRYNTRGIDTVTGVISMWAPPTENNTKAYIQSVAKSIGVNPDDHLGKFSSKILSGLMHAIIRFENGQDPYGQTVDTIAASKIPAVASV